MGRYPNARLGVDDNPDDVPSSVKFPDDPDVEVTVDEDAAAAATDAIRRRCC